MSPAFRKLLVLLPVGLLGFFYLYDHPWIYEQASAKRLSLLFLSFLILYTWVFIEVLVRRQDNFFQIAVQSSFFLYIFMVLTLTGYFVLSRELAAGQWWDKMMWRIDHRDHVNLKLFQIFRIYKMNSLQIVGNLLLLFPLGIYIQLLYRPLSNFLVTIIFCGLISVMIEGLQLATRFRSADVDDVLLNTMGAMAGVLIYRIVKFLGGYFRPLHVPVASSARPLA